MRCLRRVFFPLYSILSALNIAGDIIKLIRSLGEEEDVLTQHETTSVTQRMMRLKEMTASSGRHV
ncbi:hypothetical protein O997_03360 [Anaplasma phagocytophilum str. MRK]|nr:hypothetical protein O997_03360 [Anaplasma phagocytophilum str. MRK]